MNIKIITAFVVLLYIINIVSAGNTYELDFKKEGSYTVGLLAGDRVEFEIEDARHTILIKEIKSDSVTLATFYNIKRGSYGEDDIPNYATINSNKYLMLDFDRNDKEDLHVILRGSNNTAASVLFQLPLPANNDVKVYSKSRFEERGILNLRNIVMALFIFVVALSLFTYKYKNIRKKAKEESEKTHNLNEAETTKQE